MKKKIKIKIVICILLILIVLIILGIQILIFGIGGIPTRRKELTREELKTVKKYSEWIDEIKLLNNEKVELVGFGDTDVIKTHVKVKGDNFEELEDILDRDATFIKSNPSYFKTGQKRVLYERRQSSTFYYFVVSNTFDFDYSGLESNVYLNLDVPYTNDGLFRITYMPYEKFNKSINKKNTEVLILNIRCFYNTFNYSDYTDRNSIAYKNALAEYMKNKQLEFPIELLKEYLSLKRIVLMTDEKEDEYKLLIKNIKEACPNVTIYVVDDSDEENSSSK